MSYVIIGPDGTHKCATTQSPIISIVEADERISYQESFRWAGEPLFRCTIGTASGEVRPSSTQGSVYLTILGQSSNDVEAVRRSLMTAIGQQDISPRWLPELHKRWERLMFILNWIWHG